MKRIIDQFYGRGKTNKTVLFHFIKYDNGNYRIKRGSTTLSMHSLKYVAEERWEHLRKIFDINYQA